MVEHTTYGCSSLICNMAMATRNHCLLHACTGSALHVHQDDCRIRAYNMSQTCTYVHASKQEPNNDKDNGGGGSDGARQQTQEEP
eukprot:44881-Lingulodinium_polyedra.AAC.1